MRAVDQVLLARFEAAGLDVHDGLLIPGDPDAPVGSAPPRVITYSLPYAVYYSNVGDDDQRRLSGRKARRSVFFSLTYVGESRDQAKWLGEKLRALLQDRRIPVPGRKTWLCELEESQRVRRDDDAVRPDGKPLFYGVDNYALPITLTHPGETP